MKLAAIVYALSLTKNTPNHSRHLDSYIPNRNQDTIDQIRELFSLYDTNDDGVITIEELQAFQGAVGQNRTIEELMGIINAVDTNGNGTIEFPEFLAANDPRMMEISGEEQIRAAFNFYDDDGDGFISPEELRSISAPVGMPLTDDELSEIFSEADIDEDGHMSYEEFLEWLMITLPPVTSTPSSRPSASPITKSPTSTAPISPSPTRTPTSVPTASPVVLSPTSRPTRRAKRERNVTSSPTSRPTRQRRSKRDNRRLHPDNHASKV